METNDALDALSALAQESRLAIFRLLVEHGPGGLAAGDIAAATGLPAATLSFHLKELARAGLAVPRQEGRFIYYRADFTTMNALVGYLTENCCRGAACGPVCGPDRAPRRPRAASPRRRSI